MAHRSHVPVILPTVSVVSSSSSRSSQYSRQQEAATSQTPLSDISSVTTVPRHKTKSRVLVTYATTYVGMAVCRALVADGYSVRGTTFDARSAAAKALRESGVEVVWLPIANAVTRRAFEHEQKTSRAKAGMWESSSSSSGGSEELEGGASAAHVEDPSRGARGVANARSESKAARRQRRLNKKWEETWQPLYLQACQNIDKVILVMNYLCMDAEATMNWANVFKKATRLDCNIRHILRVVCPVEGYQGRAHLEAEHWPKHECPSHKCPLQVGVACDCDHPALKRVRNHVKVGHIEVPLWVPKLLRWHYAATTALDMTEVPWSELRVTAVLQSHSNLLAPAIHYYATGGHAGGKRKVSVKRMLNPFGSLRTTMVDSRDVGILASKMSAAAVPGQGMTLRGKRSLTHSTFLAMLLHHDAFVGSRESQSTKDQGWGKLGAPAVRSAASAVWPSPPTGPTTSPRRRSASQASPTPPTSTQRSQASEASPTVTPMSLTPRAKRMTQWPTMAPPLPPSVSLPPPVSCDLFAVATADEHVAKGTTALVITNAVYSSRECPWECAAVDNGAFEAYTGQLLNDFGESWSEKYCADTSHHIASPVPMEGHFTPKQDQSPVMCAMPIAGAPPPPFELVLPRPKQHKR